DVCRETARKLPTDRPHRQEFSPAFHRSREAEPDGRVLRNVQAILLPLRLLAGRSGPLLRGLRQVDAPLAVAARQWPHRSPIRGPGHAPAGGGPAAAGAAGTVVRADLP